MYLVHGPKKSSGHAMNSTIWSETSTITRHGDTSTRTAHEVAKPVQSADAEHMDTTAAVASMVLPAKVTVKDIADAEHMDTTAALASMVLPAKVTVKDIAAGSTAGAVDTNVPLNFPLETGTARGMLIPMPRSWCVFGVRCTCVLRPAEKT